MQLISLEKKKRGERGLTAADQEKIDALLTAADSCRRFEVEVGCGNGHFLTEYLKHQSSLFFLAVELKPGRCQKVIKKIRNHGLENVQVVAGSAEDLVVRLPSGRVDGYHVYFPDPWPKAKHKKRRFLRWPQLEELHRSLKPGGTISFASDIFDYYLQVKTLLLLHPGMEVLDTDPPGAIFCSLFANRFAELEKNTYFVAGRKKEG